MSTLFHLWVLFAGAGSTTLLDTQGLIEQALTEPTRITLENIKIAEAVNVLTEQTGVRIVMPPEVMKLIPNGPDTVIQKVDIAHVPLGEGLTRLFSPLGMNWVVENDHVAIVPKDALLCLGRAPTWAELATLSELAAIQPGSDDKALARWQPRFQFQIPGLRETWQELSMSIRSVGAGPGDEVLTIACNNLGWGWCLSGEKIIVSPIEQQIRLRLQQPISLRMNNRALFEVMSAVGQQINLSVRVEPGALTALPDQVQRNFSLNVQQKPVEQVLDTIAAYTGLGYLIGPEGVMFYRAPGPDRPTTADSSAAPSGPSDPYVAKMIVPLEDGKSLEWLIRRSELPEDLRQMRDRDLQSLIDTVRRAAKSEPRP